jgi:hypothetical protein
VATASAFGLLATGTEQATYRQDGASASIELTYKDTLTVVDTVEIDFNTVQRPWWTAPLYVTLTPDMRVTLSAAFRKLDKYTSERERTLQEVLTKYIQIRDEMVPFLGAAFEDIKYNGDTYTAIIPVVTFTRAVSHFYGSAFIIEDMGKVFSTEAMLAQVPAEAQFAIVEVTNTVGNNGAQTLGWLKSGRYGRTSDGGSNYVQQYVFDAYATNRYRFI